MELKKSLFNIAVFKQNFRRLWVLLLGMTAIWCFSFLIPLQNELGDAALHSGDSQYLTQLTDSVIELVSGMHGFMVHIAAVFSLVVAMFVFSYLFTTRSANMVHTFPLTRRSLFITNYVTGLLLLALPVTFATACALLMCRSYGVAAGGLYGWELVSVFAAEFFLFAFSVLLLMLVGNAFAVPILFLILNFFYLGCQSLADAVISLVYFGINELDLEVNLWTPLENMAFHTGPRTEYLDADLNHVTYYMTGEKILLIYVLAALVIVFLAYIVYEKKQMETVGDLITVKWLKPVFQWIGTLCSAVLITCLVLAGIFGFAFRKVSFMVLAAWVLAAGLVFYYLFQMMIDKSLHVFHKKTGISCLLYTGCAAMALLVFHLSMPRLVDYVPETSEIKSVTFHASYAFVDTQLADDPVEIDQVRMMHRLILDKREEFENPHHDQYYGDFEITYRLKNGKKVERSYPVDLEADLPAARELAGEVWDYSSQAQHILERMFGIYYDTVKIKKGYYDVVNDQGEVTAHEFSRDFAKELYEAFLKDIEDGSYGKFYSADYQKAYSEDKYKKGQFVSHMFSLDFTNRQGQVFAENVGDPISWLRDSGYRHEERTVQLVVTDQCRHILKLLEKYPELLKAVKDMEMIKNAG